jgi:hypothetical protein
MTRRAAAWWTFLLVVVALTFRLVSLGHSLPQTAESDESVWESQLACVRGKPGPFADDYARFYPDLVPIVCAMLAPAVTVPSGANPDEHRAAAGRELLRLRFIGMLISLLAIPATYRIARLVLGRTASVVASAMAATSVLTQWYAQEARPHAAAGALVAVALLLLIAARRRPGIGRWVLAGFASAAAISILQNAIVLLLAFAAALILRERNQSGRVRAWVGPAACVLVLSTAYFVQPESVSVQRDPPIGIHDVRLAGHVIHLDKFDGGGFARLFWQAWVLDTLIVVLAIAGVVRVILEHPWRSWSRTRARDFLVVLAHAVPYSIVIGMYSESYERFLIPLLPLASLCAAAAVMGWRRPPGWIAIMVATAVCVTQAGYALCFSVYRLQPDTAERAAHWLEENVDPREGPIVTLPYVELPVLRTSMSLLADAQQEGGSKFVWQHYLSGVPAPVLEANGYDLSAIRLPSDDEVRVDLREHASEFVAGIHARYAIVQRVVTHKLIEPIRTQIAERGKLVARITPVRDGGELRSLAPRRPWILALLRLKCAGPIIEIYRM